MRLCRVVLGGDLDLEFHQLLLEVPKLEKYYQMLLRVQVPARRQLALGGLPPVAGEATADGDRLVSGVEMFSLRMTQKADVAAEWLSKQIVSEAAVGVVGCADDCTGYFVVVVVVVAAAALAPLLGAPTLFGGFVPRRAALLLIETLLQDPHDVR